MPIKIGATRNMPGEEKKSRLKVKAQMTNQNKEMLEKAPAWLDSVGKREYKRIVNELLSFNFLGNLDYTTLAVLCDSYSKIAKISKDLNQQELLLIEPDGTKKENPLIKLQQRYMQIYRSYCEYYGLTPLSRFSLEIKNPKKEQVDAKQKKALDFFT